MTKKEKTKEIIKRLSKLYPKPQSALFHKTPFELLIATILSAQTTDKLVNTVTPELFNKFKTPKDFANAQTEEIDNLIRKVNFHFNKSKNIKAAAQIIVKKHHGEVPETMKGLDELPGVARKTANVVLGDAFGKPVGIVVDTHVIRLANKLGLTDQKDPVKIEKDLMKLVPKEQWQYFGHYLVYFGREYCPARPHKCENCPLKELCPDN
ncbi:MAG TPA: endonuclease III [Candidatus Sulfotelmatobacter sp.]|jgi:endonuclease-3|nr:endonuclease III [Candidatus Sulfotelmatobacter sp.]